MGWLLLWLVFISVASSVVGSWIAHTAFPVDDHITLKYVLVGVSASMVVMLILIFVLAEIYG